MAAGATATDGVVKGSGEFVRRHPAVVPTSHLFEKPTARHSHTGFELGRSPATALVITLATQPRAMDFLNVAHLPALSIDRHDDDAATNS